MRLLYSLIFCLIIIPTFGQQTITHTVYFDLDAAHPTEASTKGLISFLENMKQLSVTKVSIEGHTDKQGDNKYNNNLSRLRSESVSSLMKPFFLSGITPVINYKGENSLLTEEDEKQAINRRVVIVVYYKEVEKVITELESFYDDVETQRFLVNLDDTVFIIGKEGTVLKISPGSIQNKKGQLVQGQAEIMIKEYYQPGAILVSGLNTNSDKGLLQTGGMFNMIVVQGTDTMATKTLKPVSIKMPVVNSLKGNMNVYTMNQKADSSVWNNTGGVFKQLFSYWEWPLRKDRLDELITPSIKFENWKVGQRYTDEYIAHDNSWWFFDIALGNRSDVKTVTNRIEKIDSLTLKASLKIKYRNRGLRKYGAKYFDTTFQVKYRRAEYVGLSQNINWINCDRFLNYPNVSDFYVSTPDFRGANVMVYFRDIHAFLPAYTDGKDVYKVAKVPAGQKVWIVAYGKKDGEYYFTKHDFTTAKGVTANLNLTKIPEEEFKKELKGL